MVGKVDLKLLPLRIWALITSVTGTVPGWQNGTLSVNRTVFWTVGAKRRKEINKPCTFPLSWKQSWGGLKRQRRRLWCQMEISQPGLEMSISLPCREHLRMPEPDVLILYSPKRDQILIKNSSSPTPPT